MFSCLFFKIWVHLGILPMAPWWLIALGSNPSGDNVSRSGGPLPTVPKQWVDHLIVIRWSVPSFF